MMHKGVDVPDGDVLIHTGDFCSAGEYWEMAEALTWFRNLPHARKICVAGNHDFVAEEDPVFVQDVLGKDVDYLAGTGVDIEGKKFWGSPIQPEFHGWAFNRSRQYRRDYWDTVMPDNIDVLLTHCPPRGILDANMRGERVGDKHLFRNVTTRVKPKLHVFGHIHEARGAKAVGGTAFVNATLVNLAYQRVYECWVFDWTEEGLILVSK